MYINSNIKIVLGKLPLNQKSNKIFDELAINFLDEVSIAINKKKLALSYSDLAAFGFWCRKANLLKLSENYPRKDVMIGRGTVLHIPPSNVPMNFAYSFAFGILSGNSNIVRLPGRNFIQVNILCKIISQILKRTKYTPILKKFCFIKYDKSDEISAELSKKADARLIWGGDETIKQFKKYQTSPRCIDLFFSNRYSISVVNLNEIAKIQANKLKNLAQKFYNDSYIMDQQGCSSPQAIFWIGVQNNLVKKKFWDALSKIVRHKYDSDLSTTNQKIAALSKIAITSKLNFKTNYKDLKLVKLNIDNASKDIEKIQCHFGTFAEVHLKKMEELKKIISKKFQTITYYGFEHKVLQDFIIKNGITGIDRIVPVGRAFDIGPVWDGYDIIYSLSRIISK